MAIGHKGTVPIYQRSSGCVGAVLVGLFLNSSTDLLNVQAMYDAAKSGLLFNIFFKLAIDDCTSF